MILVIGERGNFPWADGKRVKRFQHNWKHSWIRVHMEGGSLNRLNKFLPDHVVVNLLPPDNIRGTWDHKLAKSMADVVKKNMTNQHQYYAIILLGRRLTDLFFGKGTKFGHIGKIGSLPALSLPHPSGVNRWWHRPKAMDEVEKWVRKLIETDKDGVRYDKGYLPYLY